MLKISSQRRCARDDPGARAGRARRVRERRRAARVAAAQAKGQAASLDLVRKGDTQRLKSKAPGAITTPGASFRGTPDGLTGPVHCGGFCGDFCSNRCNRAHHAIPQVTKITIAHAIKYRIVSLQLFEEIIGALLEASI